MRKHWIRLRNKKMLWNIVVAFGAFFVVTFAINAVFYYREAFRMERAERVYVNNYIAARTDSLSTLLTNMIEDTRVLREVPSATDRLYGESTERFDTFLQTYVQSRYAFCQIAYYHEASGTMIGFNEQKFFCSDATACLQALDLTKQAFETLLDADGFVLTTGERGPQCLVLSNRVDEKGVFFRTIPHDTVANRFTLPDGQEKLADTILPKWRIIVSDQLGQTLEVGTEPIEKAIKSEFRIPSLQLTVSLLAPDRTAEIVWGYLKEALIYYGGALLLCGSLLMGAFSRWLYRPIENVLSMLPEEADVCPNENEHRRISAAIDQLREEKEDAKLQMLTQKKVLRRSFLQRLVLSDQVDGANIDKLLEYYDVKEWFENYRVLICRSVSDQLDWSVIEKSLASVEITGWNIVRIPHCGAQVLLLSAMKRHADYEGFEQKAMEIAADVCGMPVRVFQSAEHHSALEANTAYLEATIAEDEGTRKEDQRPVVSYGEHMFGGETEKYQGTLISQEQEVIRLMLNSQYGAARDEFQRVLKQLADGRQPFILRRVQTIAMLNQMLFAVRSSKPETGLMERELIVLLKAETDNDTFWTAAREIAFKIIPEQRDDTYTKRFIQLNDFVQQHVCEETLCAARVADYFSMSLSSLSREFQKNTGMGFSDYLHIQRLGIAKQLLRQNGTAIKEIASAVGYSNSLALARAFKKFEGITPGEYRAKIL